MEGEMMMLNKWTIVARYVRHWHIVISPTKSDVHESADLNRAVHDDR